MRRKVTIITDVYEIKGGLRALCDTLTNNLTNRKYDVYTFSAKEQNSTSNIRIISKRLNSIYMYRAMISMICILREVPRGNDLYIIAASPMFAFILMFFCRKAKIWIATSFGKELLSQGPKTYLMQHRYVAVIELILLPLYSLLENLSLLNKQVQFFAISDTTRKRFLFRNRIRKVYPPLDGLWYVEGKERKEKTIISIGRFNDMRKDIDTLLKTALLLPDIKFNIIGSVPEKLNRNEYENVVFFDILKTGNDIKKIMDRSMIFYLPSRQEGLGIVYLEAMACGVPVVTMKNGGSEELITDNYNGMLCEVGAYRSAAKKIRSLMEDSDLYRTIQDNGYKFSIEYRNMSKKGVKELVKDD
ncbi:glycosyltransferase family 4 protein [bacterium]|nr:glycosyltransferase family 4 protein [bacterium]